MNHSIPLQQAIQMTTLYRQQKAAILAAPFQGQEILPISEKFDAEAFTNVLNQPGCTGLRIYYGMSVDQKIHAIIVGVNERDEDMIQTDGIDGQADLIIEEGFRCPPICGVASVLNS